MDMSRLKKALYAAAHKLIAAKEMLTHIDSLTGDGDLGVSMEKAAYSVLAELDKQEDDGIDGLLFRCAVAINRDAPSAMGTLTSLSVLEISKLMKDKFFFSDEDLLLIPEKIVSVVMIRGRAQLGDKTVLDSLIPYWREINRCYIESGDIILSAVSAAAAAVNAANQTKGSLAKIGRAKWIGERSRHCPDGGAIIFAIVVNAVIGKNPVFDVPDFEAAYKTQTL